jgi:hypothetical protein
VDSFQSKSNKRDVQPFGTDAVEILYMKLKLSPHIPIAPAPALLLALIDFHLIILILLTKYDVFILPMETFQN